jgi:hypothetical protein
MKSIDAKMNEHPVFSFYLFLLVITRLVGWQRLFDDVL